MPKKLENGHVHHPSCFTCPFDDCKVDRVDHHQRLVNNAEYYKQKMKERNKRRKVREQE